MRLDIRLDLFERLPELVDRLFRDANSIVFHVDVDGARRRSRSHRDAAARRRELHGVLEQVDEDLLQPALVGEHREARRALDPDGEAFGAGLLVDELQGSDDGVVKDDGLPDQSEAAGFNPRHIQNVVDDGEEVMSGCERMSRQYSTYFSLPSAPKMPLSITSAKPRIALSGVLSS